MDEAEHCDRLGLIYRARLITIGTPEELKFGLMPGSVLEVEAADVVRAASTASRRNVNGVLEAAVFGTSLHVVVREYQGKGKSSRGSWPTPGIEVFSIRPIEPSLEDVFVSLIRSHDLADENGDNVSAASR